MEKINFNVAGVTFENRQRMLADIKYKTTGERARRNWVFARLVREPKNCYDKNAIKVLVYVSTDKGKNYKWYPIGYVPRELAETLAPQLDAGSKAKDTKMAIVGGGFGRNLGCVIETTIA